MRTHAHPPVRRQAGFSLIEIMVGLLIGMLAVIVIMQVFGSAEGSKRITTGGDDAQINGTIALYGLERDIREAGYGLNSYNLLGCSLSYSTNPPPSPPGYPIEAVALPLAPVIINPAAALVPAGDAGTDTLLIGYGSADGTAEGDLISTTPSTGTYPVTTPASFNVNDRVLAQPAARPTPCALAVNTVTAKAGINLTVAPGSAAGLTLGSVVFNLGPAPIIRAYAVRQGNLTVCDYTAYNCGNAGYAAPVNPAVWVPVAPNIMSLRAQYGRDTTGVAASQMTGVVGTFNQTTPGSAADTSGLPLQCSWARTLAVRLALVARNSYYDKGTPTTAAPTWAGSTVSATAPTNPTAVGIDLSGDADWTHYRYKTLQTTVPIRNLLWQGSQATLQGGTGGC